MNADLLNSIIDGCKKQERQCQKQLYDYYSKQMTGLCLRYCGNFETARDCMHDGFIKIFENIKQYEYKGSFEGWLKKIFINIAIDNVQQSAFNVPIEMDTLEDDSDEEQEQIQQIDIEEVIDAIKKLPELMRTIFNMFNIDGFSIDEIAKKLQMTPSAVRTQHSRAKQKIRKMLNK